MAERNGNSQVEPEHLLLVLLEQSHGVVPIDVYTAAIGGQVRVPTLDGSVMLKIPPRTQADRIFRMKGKGMPRIEKPAERGDLYARAKLVLPEPLSDNEMETLRQFAEG